MSITTYPLNGITYDAADAETYLCTRTSGVFADSDCFDISISGDMEVTISTGLAWIRNTDFRGKSVCMDEDETLTISAGDATYDRIDRIVLNFSTVDNETTLQVLEGDPSSSPSAPEITQEYEQYQLGLYEIKVPAGCIELDESYITDTRLDSDVCGKMTDSVTELYEYMQVETYDPEGAAEPVAFASNTVTHTANTAVGNSVRPIWVASNGAANVSTGTRGNAVRPIYMNNGVFTNSSANRGGTAKGIYMNNGVFTNCSATVGNTVRPVFMSSGATTVCTGNVGSSVIPVYMSNGALTASSSAVGDANQPVFLNGGTITACTADMGGPNNPVYMNQGAITPCTGTVGSSSSNSAVPIYMNGGVLKNIASTIGGSKQAIYMTDGTLTAGFKVDHGTTSVSLTANTTTSTVISFSTSFSSTPHICVTPVTQYPALRSVGVYSANTSAFTLYMYHGGTSSTTTSVYWIAIGT